MTEIQNFKQKNRRLKCLVIGICGLEFIWNLVLVICYFRFIRVRYLLFLQRPVSGPIQGR